MRIAITVALSVVALVVAACGSDEAAEDSTLTTTPPLAATAVEPAGPTVATHRTAQAWEPVLPASPDEGGYRFVIAQGAFADRAEALRAQDPDVRTLVYKNVTQIVESDVPLADNIRSTGVDYQATVQDHPEWLLRDAAGTPITRHYTADETDYLVDVGSASYQAAWADSVLAQAQRDGWDGVFLDDVLPTLEFWLPSGNVGEVVAYPTDAAWQAATRSFLSAVATRLRAAGLVVIANICCDLTYRTRAAWAQFLDGTMDEGFLNPTTRRGDPLVGLSENTWQDWRGYLREVEEAEAAGKYLLATTLGEAGDEARARYALGTFLLVSGDHGSFEYHGSDHEPTSYDALATARGLGVPLAPYYKQPNGLYVREFSHGVVVVNPNPAGTAALSVQLDARQPGAAPVDVTGIEVSPLDAAIVVAR